MPILTEIHIDRAIIHHVDKKISKIEPLINFSTHSIEPDNTDLSPLITRINGAFGDHSQSLKLSIKNFDPNTTPLLCHQIIQNFNNSNIFDQNSIQLARNLAASFFTPVIPGGLLVIALCTDLASRMKFVLLIKAEIHDGYQTTETNGVTMLQYIRRIVLSKNSKLYKIGLILQKSTTVQDDSNLNDLYDSYVFDLQMKPSSKDEAASYFFSKFLNCEIQKTDNKLTKRFYETTKEFIKTIDDDALRFDASTNLRSYLRNENFDRIDVTEYCSQFIPQEYKTKYLNRMRTEEGFSRVFNKNTNLITQFLKRRILKFNNGVEMRIPQDGGNRYEITERTEESTTVKIFGRYVGDR